MRLFIQSIQTSSELRFKNDIASEAINDVGFRASSGALRYLSCNTDVQRQQHSQQK